jgi:hypothetical protein
MKNPLDLYDLKVVAVTTEMTDGELLKMMRTLEQQVRCANMGFVLTVSGYDNDLRELWEIPKCIELFRKLVDMGFISVLEVSTHIKEISRIPDCPGFGAFEIWSIADGRMTGGTTTYPKSVIIEFLDKLQESNQRCTANCAVQMNYQHHVDPRLL